MRRRDVLRVLAFAPWVVHAQAQQPRKIWRIAFVYPTRAPATVSERTPGVQALFAELQRLGYVEQDNLLVERYPADGHSERLPSLASEAAQANPDLIFALSGRAMLAVKRATDRIPVVGMSSDPIAYGIVTSLSRPEGNIAGVIVDAGAELWGKRLEILKEAAPRIRKVFQVTPRASFDSGVCERLSKLPRSGPVWLSLGRPSIALRKTRTIGVLSIMRWRRARMQEP